MDHHINPKKSALTFALLLGGLHVVWSVFVGFGWAQAMVNFSLWAHMISLPIVIKAFDFTASITVVIVASMVGYLIGHIFAKIWNRLHRA